MSSIPGSLLRLGKRQILTANQNHRTFSKLVSIEPSLVLWIEQFLKGPHLAIVGKKEETEDDSTMMGAV